MDQSSDLTNLILQQFNESESHISLKLAESLKIDHQLLVGYLLKLESEQFIKTSIIEEKFWEPTAEGNLYLQKGTPEFILTSQVPTVGIAQKDLQKLIDDSIFKVGFSNAMNKKYIKIQNGLIFKNTDKGEIIDEDYNLLKEAVEQKLDDLKDKENLEKLKKRKLIQKNIIKGFKINKGLNYQNEFVKKLADLNVDLLKNGKWKTQQFKEMNYNAKGKPVMAGSLHPLLKVRKQFSQILISMGFQEMETNQYVENSFFNFDALFQPQQHPARDAHDTFFVSDPKLSIQGDEELWNRVKTMHEIGGAGSIGYNYQWSLNESLKNIFRTHTTAVSSKVLWKIAQDYKKNGFYPKKFFSIDRVFRNETLDATHLAEFNQVEGIVIDKNVNLGTLIGIIKEFFKKIGIEKLWFKPTYNPYTEPSMEVYGFHPILNKKVEIGNSGIFRPEMLQPLGLPEDVNVIAWGLSLERPTMIQYNVHDIRTLIGHEVEVKTVRSNPFCCFN